MRRITVLSVGKPDLSIYPKIQNYLKRLSQFIPTEHSFIKSQPTIRQESERLLARIHPSAYTVVCAEEGNEFTSAGFARLVGKLIESYSSLVFVVGGADGLDSSLKQRANMLLSLSKLTLQHDVALLTLTEQLYRAMTILKGLPYHR